jgi:hypothetical protein
MNEEPEDSQLTVVWKLFDPLWAGLEEQQFLATRPLLAHYTSISTIEKILANDEIWFSNPLLMNDLEEVRFSVNQGYHLVLESEHLRKSCGTEERISAFDEAWIGQYNQFADEHVLDTYVFCLSEHDRDDRDGLLSMWRGYGGNGAGAALVLDTAKLEAIDTSAFLLAKVDYRTTEERVGMINQLIATLATIVPNVETNWLYLAAHALFERIKVFALFSKHRGFAEEREWRVVYMPGRDLEQKLRPFCTYVVTARGLEPKLKFKVGPIDGQTGKDLSLEGLIDRIVLGPSVASPLSKATFLRMLERLNKSALQSKVQESRIPYRAF